MYISAKTDYAVRALLELTAQPDHAVRAEDLAKQQNLPVPFLENILIDLRRAGLVRSQRRPESGYRLARKATDITVADVMRALDGPLAEVHGLRPEAAVYHGPAVHLQDVWVAVRASLRSVLDGVTLAQVASGKLPARVRRLIEDHEAWESKVTR